MRGLEDQRIKHQGLAERRTKQRTSILGLLRVLLIFLLLRNLLHLRAVQGPSPDSGGPKPTMQHFGIKARFQARFTNRTRILILTIYKKSFGLFGAESSAERFSFEYNLFSSCLGSLPRSCGDLSPVGCHDIRVLDNSLIAAALHISGDEARLHFHVRVVSLGFRCKFYSIITSRNYLKY